MSFLFAWLLLSPIDRWRRVYRERERDIGIRRHFSVCRSPSSMPSPPCLLPPLTHTISHTAWFSPPCLITHCFLILRHCLTPCLVCHAHHTATMLSQVSTHTTELSAHCSFRPCSVVFLSCLIFLFHYHTHTYYYCLPHNSLFYLHTHYIMLTDMASSYCYHCHLHSVHILLVLFSLHICFDIINITIIIILSSRRSHHWFRFVFYTPLIWAIYYGFLFIL